MYLRDGHLRGCPLIARLFEVMIRSHGVVTKSLGHGVASLQLNTNFVRLALHFSNTVDELLSPFREPGGKPICFTDFAEVALALPFNICARLLSSPVQLFSGSELLLR
jgi:hypothetical protein